MRLAEQEQRLGDRIDNGAHTQEERFGVRLAEQEQRLGDHIDNGISQVRSDVAQQAERLQKLEQQHDALRESLL